MLTGPGSARAGSCRSRLQPLNPHARDAVAIHLQHRKSPRPVCNRFPSLRNIAEAEQEEASESFKPCLARQVDAVLHFQIANRGAAVELHHRRSDERQYAFNVVLVADFTENLLQRVLERHQADDGSKLIHHQRHVRVALAKLVYQLADRLRLGHHQRLAHQSPQLERTQRLALVHRDLPLHPDTHQVLIVDDADDFFPAVFVHRNARVLMLQHNVQDLIDTRVDRKRYEVVAWHHDFSNGISLQVEHAANRRFLKTLQVPFAPAGTDNELQLLNRMPPASMAALPAQGP